ncbi:MAG TPA: HEAT repeat domain-containing protein [Bryobacteraceae bacterium]|nr:HEAT repeat domain-containing protein [Bryobacteraceae bacterium]
MEELIRVLEKGSASAERVGAAGELGSLRDPRAIDPLTVALSDSDWGVQKAAAGALGEIGGARAVEPLIGALNNTDLVSGAEVAKALGKIKDPRAVQPLIAALKGRDAVDAAEALAAIGAPAVGALIAALKNPDSDVRWHAAVALGNSKDPRAVEPLAGTLEGADSPLLRSSAAGALGEIRDPRAVEPLARVLTDPSPDVRDHALSALGAIGAPAVSPLLAALKSVHPDVRRGAAEALSRCGDPRATGLLIGILKDTDSSVRAAAVTTLASIGAEELLIAALNDRDSHIRQGAARALGGKDSPRAIGFLLEAFKEHNSQVIAGAFPFFIKRGEPASEDALIQALDKFGSEETVEAFLNCGNPALKAAATRWAQARGYSITKIATEFQTASNVRWGGGR